MEKVNTPCLGHYYLQSNYRIGMKILPETCPDHGVCHWILGIIRITIRIQGPDYYLDCSAEVGIFEQF